MSVTVNLPQGCRGFQMEDGTSYRGKEGGSVTVSDEHGAAIRRQVGGDGGLTGYGTFRQFMGTKSGRWCSACKFLANAWSATCPRCGGDTVPESEMPAAPPSRMPSDCLVPIVPAG